MKFARPINTKGAAASISSPYSFGHKGIDYRYPTGTTIYASQAGRVSIATDRYTNSWLVPWIPALKRFLRALTTADYGNLVRIDHAEGFSTFYAHLKRGSLLVKIGDTVSKGQPIAQLNNTGNSSGAHLHWELRLNNRSINPVPYVDFGFTKYK